MRHGGIFIACFALLGCVGDSSTTPNDAGVDADLTGTLMHPCFPDHGCLNGLTCQLPADICVDLGDGSQDGTMESGASDASDASDSSDARTMSTCEGTSGAFATCTTGVPCADQSASAILCQAGCTSPQVAVACGNTKECPTGMPLCCLDLGAVTVSGGSCTQFAQYSTAVSKSPTFCASTCTGNLQLCISDSECTGGTFCNMAKFAIGSSTYPIGICGP